MAPPSPHPDQTNDGEAVLTSVVPTVEPGDGRPTAGHTPGLFDVTEDGAATYDIPLWVPPGRAGVQPDLSFVYSSRGPNGVVGMGWSLEAALAFALARAFKISQPGASLAAR